MDKISKRDLHRFYTRLGANFYVIHSLFHHLYGQRADFKEQIIHLVEVMARRYIERSDELERIDIAREADHKGFLSQEWVGMALYADGFAGDLNGVTEHCSYFQDLGINMIHIMPIMTCPKGASDGGYTVSNFRDIDFRFGTLEQLRALSQKLRLRNILLTLDVVVMLVFNSFQWDLNYSNPAVFIEMVDII